MTPAPTPPTTYRRNTSPMPMVRVNLLPGEVVAGRKAHRTRRIVAVGLVVLVLVLAAVSFLVRGGIGAANDDLNAAQAVNSRLTAQQGKYGDVVAAQSDLQAVLGQLGQLTAADVGWAAVTRAIRTAAPVGVTITGVGGTGASDSGAAGSAGGAPGGAGTTTAPGGDAAPGGTAVAPGAVVITGFATDPATVAAFVDALAQQPTLANVVATTVINGEGGQFSFGINADVTGKGLSHRFGTPGGK